MAGPVAPLVLPKKLLGMALKLDKLAVKEEPTTPASVAIVDHLGVRETLPEHVRQLFVYARDNPWDDETLVQSTPPLWISTWMAGFSEEWTSSHGIDCVLNVSFELQPPSWTSTLPAYLHLPIMDEESFAQFTLFQQAADFIHHNMSAGRTLLVHCSAGESRSVTSLLAYFIIHKREPLATALSRIRSLRHRAYPNIGFMLYLLALEKCTLREQSIPVAALLLHRNFAASSFAAEGLGALQKAHEELHLKLQGVTMKAATDDLPSHGSSIA